MKKVLVFAHRGGGKGILENRLETIKKSLKKKFIDGIEVDVRMTKDKVLVIHHDRGVYLNGKIYWIDKLTYDQIKHLGIPTLSEVIDLFKNSDKILNLDIKEKGIEDELVGLIKKTNYQGLIFFDSCFPEVLFNLQEKLTNGYYFISSNPADSRDFAKKRFLKLFLIFLSIAFSRFIIFLLKRKIKKIKVDGVSLYYRFVSKSLVKDLKEMGFKVFVWGTDEKKKIKKLLSMGIDGIKVKTPEAIF